MTAHPDVEAPAPPRDPGSPPAGQRGAQGRVAPGFPPPSPSAEDLRRAHRGSPSRWTRASSEARPAEVERPLLLSLTVAKALVAVPALRRPPPPLLALHVEEDALVPRRLLRELGGDRSRNDHRSGHDDRFGGQFERG